VVHDNRVRQPDPRERTPKPSQGHLSHDDRYVVTTTSRHLDTSFSKPLCGQLEVSLDVPNLGQAVGFYSTLFDASPLAAERRMVWFDVPESTLRIELREALTPTAARLRLCTEPRRLQVLAARLSQRGVAITQAGLTREGNPRAISFHDPGCNWWELYASIIVAPPPMSIRRGTGRSRRSVAERVRAAVRAASALEARFDQERSRDQNLALSHSHRTAASRRSSSIGQRPR
jgi:hypothetical protein